MVFISEKEGQMHIKPTDDNTAAQFVARFWLRETKVSGLYSSHALILHSSNHDSGPESKLSSLNDTPQGPCFLHTAAEGAWERDLTCSLQISL